MKRLLFVICTLFFIACNGKKVVDVAGLTPLSFVGCWECVGRNDSIQNLSVCIGERNDSLLVAFYWEREKPFYMSGNPQKDSKGDVIPQVCISAPKSGNKVASTIVNQYFSVFQNYPESKYFPVVFELKSLDTLTFKIMGDVNFWPDSAVMVRKNSDNYVFSAEITDLYRENDLVPDADVSVENNFDVVGITLSPFVGEWVWEKSSSWENFTIIVGEKGDSLLLTASGVFLGGARMQMPTCDNDGNSHPQARLLAPKHGNKAIGYFLLNTDCAVTLELFSNNTLLFKTDEPLGFWPDSAVMVRNRISHFSHTK